VAQQNLKRTDEDRMPGVRSALRVITGSRSESGVRSLCPFCGSRDPSPDAPCCSEWNVSLWADDAADLNPPASRWLQLRAQIEKIAAFRPHLSQASQLLVTLLASTIVAVVVSITMQRRAAMDGTAQLDEARIVGQQMISALSSPTTVGEDMTSKAPQPPIEVASTGPAGGESASAQAPKQEAAPPVAEPVPVPSAPPSSAAAVAVLAPAEAPAPAAVPAVDPAGPIAPAAPAPATSSAPAVAESPTDGVPASKPELHKPSVAKAAKPAIVREPAPPRAAVRAEVAARPPVVAAPTESTSTATAARPAEESSETTPVVASRIPDRDVALKAREEASTAWREENAPVREPQRNDPWQLLHRGMTPAAVRRLLGEPKWKRHLVDTDVWLYVENTLFSDGWVAFSETGDGGLLGWRHP
jgi:hypothetical protein